MKQRLFHSRRFRMNWSGLVPVLVAVGLTCGRVSGALITGWGANDAHQLEPPLWLTNAISVSAGASHALALLATGDAVAWGDDQFGQTAIPPAAGQLVSVSCGFRHSLALRADGSILGWGDDSLGQASPPAGTNYVAIAAGGSHSLALRGNGTVVAWGTSPYGQTNVPVNLRGVQTIAAGGYHSLALQSNGTVVAWGYNGDGQRSVPAGVTNVIAIAAGFRHSLALRSDSTVAAWGFNGQGQTNVPANLSNVVAVAAGRSQSLALCQDGAVVAWGGPAGGVAVPEGLTQVQALAAGGNFNLALVPIPAVLRQPADTLIVPGQTVTLTAFAAGSESMRFQWQKDGVDLPGQTNMSLTISNAGYGDFGDYWLRVEDGATVVFSQVARLIAPPSILSQPQSLGIYYGDTAVFHVTATGTAPSCLSMVYRHDGGHGRHQQQPHALQRHLLERRQLLCRCHQLSRFDHQFRGVAGGVCETSAAHSVSGIPTLPLTEP